MSLEQENAALQRSKDEEALLLGNGAISVETDAENVTFEEFQDDQGIVEDNPDLKHYLATMKGEYIQAEQARRTALKKIDENRIRSEHEIRRLEDGLRYKDDKIQQLEQRLLQLEVMMRTPQYDPYSMTQPLQTERLGRGARPKVTQPTASTPAVKSRPRFSTGFLQGMSPIPEEQPRQVIIPTTLPPNVTRRTTATTERSTKRETEPKTTASSDGAAAVSTAVTTSNSALTFANTVSTREIPPPPIDYDATTSEDSDAVITSASDTVPTATTDSGTNDQPDTRKKQQRRKKQTRHRCSADEEWMMTESEDEEEYENTRRTQRNTAANARTATNPTGNATAAPAPNPASATLPPLAIPPLDATQLPDMQTAMFYQMTSALQQMQQNFQAQQTLNTTLSERQGSRSSTDSKLEPFNGKEDFTVWKSLFKTKCKQERLTREQMAQKLWSFTRGDAHKVLMGGVNTDDRMDYKKLMQALTTRYRPMKTQTAYFDDWIDLKKTKDQTIQQYVDVIRRAERLAFPDDNEGRLARLRDKFLEALTRKQRGTLQRFHPRWRQMQLERLLAAHIEGLCLDDVCKDHTTKIREEHIGVDAVKGEVTYTPASTVAPGHEVMKDLINMVSDLKQQLNQKPKAEVTTTEPIADNTQTTQNRSDSDRFKCFVCGRFGHWANSCPNELAAQQLAAQQMAAQRQFFTRPPPVYMQPSVQYPTTPMSLLPQPCSPMTMQPYQPTTLQYPTYYDAFGQPINYAQAPTSITGFYGQQITTPRVNAQPASRRPQQKAIETTRRSNGQGEGAKYKPTTTTTTTNQAQVSEITEEGEVPLQEVTSEVAEVSPVATNTVPTPSQVVYTPVMPPMALPSAAGYALPTPVMNGYAIPPPLPGSLNL